MTPPKSEWQKFFEKPKNTLAIILVIGIIIILFNLNAIGNALMDLVHIIEGLTKELINWMFANLLKPALVIFFIILGGKYLLKGASSKKKE